MKLGPHYTYYTAHIHCDLLHFISIGGLVITHFFILNLSFFWSLPFLGASMAFLDVQDGILAFNFF